MKKILPGLLGLLMMLSAHMAMAQVSGTDYTKAGVSDQIKQFLCAPTPAQPGQNDYISGDLRYSGANNQASGDLYNCINRLYKFAIVLASVVGVFFVVIAGYLYMSAEGNAEGIDKAKSILVSTVTALVILFGGYVLLKAINPDLIQFRSIQPPSVRLDPAQAPVSEGTGGVDKTRIGGEGTAGCNDCADYTQNGLKGNSTQKAGKNTFLNKALIAKLQKINATFTNWQINEAFPPTVDHASACHNNGTCVDIGVLTRSAAEVNKLCQAMKDAGIDMVNKVLNEYGSYNAKDMPNCPAPKIYRTTTGGHLHIIN